MLLRAQVTENKYDSFFLDNNVLVTEVTYQFEVRICKTDFELIQ